MPWNDNSGSGNNGGDKGPWGQPGGNNNGGNRPSRPTGSGNGGGKGQQPDIEELLRSGRDRFKNAIPGGGKGRGGRSGGGEFKPPSKKIFMLGALGLLALYLASGIYTVEPGERAVVTTFGKYTKMETEGLNWHIPSPFQAVRKVSVTERRQTSIGGNNSVEGLMLTSDLNIVDVSLVVDWRLKDEPGQDGDLPSVAKFVYRIDEPVALVKAVGQSALREVIGTNRLDPIISNGRALVPEEMRKLMQEALNSYGAGIEIVRVNFQKSDPPNAVVEAFRDVVDARSDAEKAQNDAIGYRNRVVPEARADAQRMLFEAEAYKATEVAKARGAAARFNDIYAEYAKAPEVTRQRMYLETMEGVLGGMNKIIIDEGAGGAVPYLNLNEINRNTRSLGN